MVSPGDAKAFVVGLLLGFVPGYLHGSETLNVVSLVLASPIGDLLASGYAFLQGMLVTYGIWAFVGASFMKGMLLFFFAPAESVTPLYILYAADSALEAVLIVVVAAATITLGNTVIYFAARFAGRTLFDEQTGRVWRAIDWTMAHHGRLTVFALRIVPWIGGWAAIPAGLARMRLRDFMLFTFLGFLLYEGFFGMLAWYGIKQGMLPQLAFLSQLLPAAPG